MIPQNFTPQIFRLYGIGEYTLCCEYNNGMHAVVQYVLFRASSRKREFTPRCAYINTQGVNL